VIPRPGPLSAMLTARSLRGRQFLEHDGAGLLEWSSR
jgi:hypothetical protein